MFGTFVSSTKESVGPTWENLGLMDLNIWGNLYPTQHLTPSVLANSQGENVEGSDRRQVLLQGVTVLELFLSLSLRPFLNPGVAKLVLRKNAAKTN
ncbi:hypothetical protein CEXT_34211 [Caerostris extrusa]|uniref:Uncharacterized protein n=1 Tax=Caerostris extrusa TaxID=172846 RepID=A0AAV4PHS5_CAEEX|nr:hypothetical protein CEXT_34211 [Caerostris extrusa]